MSDSENAGARTSANIEFEYLYRDAANYKFFDRVVLEGSDLGLDVEQASRRMSACLLDGQNFVADQLYLEELFPVGRYEFPTQDDHCYHEFHALSETDAAPTDPFSRTIDDLVSQMEQIGPAGWRDFDPAEKSGA